MSGIPYSGTGIPLMRRDLPLSGFRLKAGFAAFPSRLSGIRTKTGSRKRDIPLWAAFWEAEQRAEQKREKEQTEIKNPQRGHFVTNRKQKQRVPFCFLFTV